MPTNLKKLLEVGLAQRDFPTLQKESSSQELTVKR